MLGEKTPAQVRNELLLNYASLFERGDELFRLASLLDYALDQAKEKRFTAMWDDRAFTVEYLTEISAGLRVWSGDFWEIRIEGGVNGWDYRAIFDHIHGNACEDSLDASIQILYPHK